MPAVAEVPELIKPFHFHGVVLAQRGEEWVGSCPFCDKDKFSVRQDTGQWQCWSCRAGEEGRQGGNVTSFLRLLWTFSVEQVEAHQDLYAQLAGERGLQPQSLLRWGLAPSVLTGGWLLPGHGVDGMLNQLYRWIPLGRGRHRFLPTPGVHQHLLGMLTWRGDRKTVYVCEGAWDGIALWEVLQEEPKSESIVRGDVLAVPGCGIFLPSWTKLLAGKRVVLLYDNDHPRRVCGNCRKSHRECSISTRRDGRTPSAGKTCPYCKHASTDSDKVLAPGGWVGMQRAAGVLGMADDAEKPEQVLHLAWGGKEQTHAPDLADGWDMRDHLHTSEKPLEAFKKLLLTRVFPVPQEWLMAAREAKLGQVKLAPIPCTSWEQLVLAWRKALRWRRGLEDCLAVMLAVALSTEQTGDQLFLQVIGDPGSGKSRLCDAMLVSRHCFALEHLTGFHSGYTDSSGEDFSLLARINRKTLITPEGDVLMSSPHFAEIMSQQRRIFDGSSGASYKNRKEDMRYTGLRTPWIMAGTPALLEKDQSRLGDRFLKIRLDRPDSDERASILQRVGYQAWEACAQISNGQAQTQMAPGMAHAFALTGGYVDHLRKDPARLLESVRCQDQEQMVGVCADLAELTADLRARPGQEGPRGAITWEVDAFKELPTRLTHQLIRLTRCLAVVLGEFEVTPRVLEITRRVALDTCWDRSLESVRQLHKAGDDGLSCYSLGVLTGQTEDKERHLMKFLKRIEVTEAFIRKNRSGIRERPRWRLTQRVRELWNRVILEE